MGVASDAGRRWWFCLVQALIGSCLAHEYPYKQQHQLLVEAGPVVVMVAEAAGTAVSLPATLCWMMCQPQVSLNCVCTHHTTCPGSVHRPDHPAIRGCSWCRWASPPARRDGALFVSPAAVRRLDPPDVQSWLTGNYCAAQGLQNARWSEPQAGGRCPSGWPLSLGHDHPASAC